MITSLKDLPGDLVHLFGAKASSLAILIQNNINVPEGYALSNEVFLSYLAFNKFCYTTTQYLSYHNEIQDFILKGEFPQEIKVKLLDIYNNLTNGSETPIVIRSSANCEDGKDYSMAGVFVSYVNINSFNEFEYSIKKCYASLFSDKALVLMLRNKIKYDSIGMGIIIQKFIEGEASGVMFTADTISMDDRLVVINAVKGGCSGFVDGSKISSCCSVKKCNRQIIDYNVSQDSPEIKGEMLDVLVAAAREIEEIFGYFQDIEWTIRDYKIFILQSRPITAFKYNDKTIAWSISAEDTDKTWTLTSAEPLLPLKEELLLIYNEGITRGMLESGKGGGNISRIVNGYEYNYIAPRDLERRKKFKEKLAILNDEGKNIYQDLVLPQLMQCRNELDKFVNMALQNRELLEYIRKSLEFFKKSIYLHILAVDGSMYLDDFKKYCTEIIPDISENDLYDLVYQKSRLTIEREQVLDIAEFINSCEDLKLLFDSYSFNEIIYARLNRYAPGERLLQIIEDYLKDFGLISLEGHRQITPEVLQEKPWKILDKIRVCMDMNRDIYNDSLNKTFKNKERIIAKINGVLNENDRKDFTKRLMTAEKSFQVNDDHCFYIDLTSQGYLRLVLIKAGEVLTERKVISQPEEIYFLKLDEIYDFLAGKKEDLSLELGKRKELYYKQKKLIPPDYLGKVPAKKNLNKEVDDIKKVTLKGESGFGKKVTGRVKVIIDSTRSNEIKDDCILVLKHGHGCYFLPFMNRIKGLIYDEGSPYDHPGILAREYEIPSIYKTKYATKVLKDGDLIELDGINGEVNILKKLLD